MNLKRQRNEFLAEAEDILAAMDEDIMRLAAGVRAGTIEPAVLNKIFRSAHTIKGLSSIFEFSDITDVSHALEDKLDMLRLGRIVLNEECLESVIRAQGLLTRIVSARGSSGFTNEVSDVIFSLSKGREVNIASTELPSSDEIFSALTEYETFRLSENRKSGKRLFVVDVGFEASSFDSGYSAFTAAISKVADIIATLPSIKQDSRGLFFEMLIATSVGHSELEASLGDFTGVTAREIGEGVKEEVVPYASLGAASVKERESQVQSMRRNAATLRVDVMKIDNLMHSVDELWELKEDFRRLCERIGEKQVSSELCLELKDIEDGLENTLAGLKEGVLAVKMVPIGRLFKRFEPYVKRLAYECGKGIDIVTYGGDTELNRTIIEELADPLMHIIRNVIDHAIESPGQRRSSGKSCSGAVSLSAYHEGGHVAIEVKDDGSGIDPDAICATALSKGLIDKEAARSMERSEKLNLIFLPGFTTSDEISATSGRGVGLDVVRENIALLNGLVEIETVQGKGTRFILTIPVTQSMIGALICEEGGNTIAVPGSRVVEIVQLTNEVSIIDGFITINHLKMRAIRPSSLFHPQTSSAAGFRYAIVTRAGRERLCLVVDRVTMTEVNIIIRPLPLGHKISGVMGLTEADNNDAVLVLDIAGILESLSSEQNTAPRFKSIV